MSTLRSCIPVLLAAAITFLWGGTTPVLAQGTPGATIADAATFEAALAGHGRAPDFSRARLANLLDNDEVRALADARGIDLDRVEERAATLTDAELVRMESLVSEVSEALDLNSTITISVTTVIIILLLLILIT